MKKCFVSLFLVVVLMLALTVGVSAESRSFKMGMLDGHYCRANTTITSTGATVATYYDSEGIVTTGIEYCYRAKDGTLKTIRSNLNNMDSSPLSISVSLPADGVRSHSVRGYHCVIKNRGSFSSFSPFVHYLAPLPRLQKPSDSNRGVAR